VTLVVILTMKISIITPAFGQLNWLRMCIASVADQVGTQYESAKVNGGKVGMAESKVDGRTSTDAGKDVTLSPICNLLLARLWRSSNGLRH